MEINANTLADINPAFPEIPKELKILEIEKRVLFPFMLLPLTILDEPTQKLVEEAVASNRIVAAFATKEKDENQDGASETSVIGTAALILRMLRTPQNTIEILLQGIQRVRLIEFVQKVPYPVGKVELLRDSFEKDVVFEGLMRTALGQFHEIVSRAPYLPDETELVVNGLNQASQKIDFMATNLNLSKAEQQALLEELDLTKRLKMLIGYFDRELEILKVGTKIHQEIQQKADKAQRDAYLREQLAAIKKELGESDEQTAIINEYHRKLEKANLPKEVQEEAERELNRMSQIPQMSPEYTVSRTYLDWLVDLPWNLSTEDNLDVDRAQQVLDEDHHDLSKPKDRVIDYLSVRKLKADMKGPILCFLGPPGTGKTSLGQSIARALGRKFLRISLGGIRDEAEIRGHRRTYIGALPGRIIQGLRRIGSNNPVMMLDEIDKVGTDFRGDPASALLEVLDPEQNKAFVDHYIDLPFDLSKVLFIATANVGDTIPAPLWDRMEVIEMPGYIELDKIQIGKKYLIPKQIAEHGLETNDVVFEENVISKIIRNYTREAGVRNLERQIATICRKSARKIATGNKPPIRISEKDVAEVLGPEMFLTDIAEEKDEVGVVVGMAWTPVGGDILFVEASAVPGEGRLKLTGRLGDVMKESAEAAMTYVRSRADKLGLPPDFYKKWDVHIHIPEGAVPKDGPSAGVTLTTALASVFTHRPVRRDLSMTGEITLRGKVLPIGGVRDKVLAAHRAGIKRIILPMENKRNLEDVPEEVKREIKFIFVDNLDEVLDAALLENTKAKSAPTERMMENIDVG